MHFLPPEQYRNFMKRRAYLERMRARIEHEDKLIREQTARREAEAAAQAAEVVAAEENEGEAQPEAPAMKRRGRPRKVTVQ